MAAIPVGLTLYRSSLPTEIPTTKSVKAEPYVVIAVLRAVISAEKKPSPPEAQRPRRRVVPSAIAAGMAEIGSFVELPPC